MNRILAFAPIIVLVVIAAIGGFMLRRNDGAPREKFAAGMVGQMAPSYALSALNGEGLVTSDAVRGRAHLINLFASWCTPCRAEHPQLMALRAQGVEIVGVAYKDEAADTERFVSELGNPYSAIGMDPEGRLGLEFGATGAPETYVIGADGTVRVMYRGALTPEIIEQQILPALNAR